MMRRQPRLPPPWKSLRLLVLGCAILAVFMAMAIVGVGRSRGSANVALPQSPPPGHTAFFVSPDGNDANPGVLGKPWRTIDRAMAHHYRAGDQLLFRRGGEYFGTIDKIPTPDGTRRWLIGAYGEGAKPILTNAKLLNNSTAWALTAPNVWRINLRDPATHGGWRDGGTNIGFLRAGAAIYGAKKKSLDELRGQWDFYDDGAFLYVRSTSNPTTLAPTLLAAPDSILIRTHSNTEIDGLEMRNCGGHAIRGEVNPVVNVHVSNNYIHDIGGSYLIGYADDHVRYGNAIECLDTSSDWLIQGNEIHDVYDTAFTCQGSGTWNDIRVAQNYFHDNSHNLEFWTKAPGGGFDDIVVEGNLFADGGSGWGGVARPDQDNRAQFISYGWDLPANVLVTRNRVRRASGAYRYQAPEVGYPKGWVFTDNDIQLSSGTLMQFGQPYTIEDAAAWAAANHTESGSTFEVLGGS